MMRTQSNKGRESQAAQIRAQQQEPINIPPHLIDSRIQKEPNQREPLRLRVSPSELAADVRNGMPKKWLCAKYQFSSLTEASVGYFVCIYLYFFAPHPAPQALLDLFIFIQGNCATAFARKLCGKARKRDVRTPPRVREPSQTKLIYSLSRTAAFAPCCLLHQGREKASHPRFSRRRGACPLHGHMFGSICGVPGTSR